MAKRISRPVGVYVLTILLVLGTGIFPVLHVVIASRETNGELSFTLVFVTFFLAVFSAATAIWAFIGHNEGRIAVLIFVSVNFLWWFFLAITGVASSGREAIDGPMLLLQMIRPSIMLGLFWWYFTKKDVVAYYRQQGETTT